MNRIDKVFSEKKENLLNIYFTAGYPQLEDTKRIAAALDAGGVDLIEIGLPFSDPIADGPTIQESSEKALSNGMSLKVLFSQLKDIRQEVKVPILLMGYLNPILQFGLKEFCEHCQEVGIDGLIIPDLPMLEYKSEYKKVLDAHGLYNIFLISPQTEEKRIREIDDYSEGFIYMVSSASITGAKSSISDVQIDYFQKVRSMNLRKNLMIGFGISNHATFSKACEYSNGAIVGSAFIKQLTTDSSEKGIKTFITTLKNG